MAMANQKMAHMLRGITMPMVILLIVVAVVMMETTMVMKVKVKVAIIMTKVAAPKPVSLWIMMAISAVMYSQELKQIKTIIIINY
jgi:hypothetical protein